MLIKNYVCDTRYTKFNIPRYYGSLVTAKKLKPTYTFIAVGTFIFFILQKYDNTGIVSLDLLRYYKKFQFSTSNFP
jgi:hypothetical protein